jgi:hypothetical protein
MLSEEREKMGWSFRFRKFQNSIGILLLMDLPYRFTRLCFWHGLLRSLTASHRWRRSVGGPGGAFKLAKMSRMSIWVISYDT